MHRTKILVVCVVLLSFGLERGLGQSPSPLLNDRVVFLAGGLGDTDLVTLSANLAASKCGGMLLLDSAPSTPFLKAFLSSFRPGRIVPVGSFAEGQAALSGRLGKPVAAGLVWKEGPPTALWSYLFARAKGVVVCPAEPRRLLLQAAYLAGAAEMPFLVLQGKAGEEAVLREWLTRWRTHQVLAVGSAAEICGRLPEVQLTRLKDEAAVVEASLHHQTLHGPIQTLVVANPADLRTKELGGMSRLAPWVALQKRAALLLTNEAGDNTTQVVNEASEKTGTAPGRVADPGGQSQSHSPGKTSQPDRGKGCLHRNGTLDPQGRGRAVHLRHRPIVPRGPRGGCPGHGSTAFAESALIRDPRA